MFHSDEAPLESETPFGLVRAGRRQSFVELGNSLRKRFLRRPSVALAVGTFAAVPYVHLHLEARKRLYPDVPLLVHDDCSPKAAELDTLCREYGADFEQNTTRFPPCKGDLSVFAGGIQWAAEGGAQLLVKMSRRFVPKIRWVDELVRLAMRSDHATYSAWTTSFNFGFRTECVALAVAEWREMLDEIIAAIHAPGEPFVEGFIHDLARQIATRNSLLAKIYDAREGPRPNGREGYALWRFIGTDRCTPSTDHLWHDAESPSAYAELAQRWGLPYDERDFLDPNMGFGSRPEFSPFGTELDRSITSEKPPRVAVYTMCHNEEVIAPFFGRHYAWAEKIVVYDDQSCDRTRDILAAFPNVELRHFDSGGVIDNDLLRDMKNHCWKECRGAGFDFIIVVDLDELVWARDLYATLRRMKAKGVTLIRPTGYDMVSECIPQNDMRLVDQIQCGVLNCEYSKPCIFSPDRVEEILFEAGCRECHPIGEVKEESTDEIKNLHYRFLSSEYYVGRSRLRRERVSPTDRVNGWGVHDQKTDEEFADEYTRALALAVTVL